MNGWFSPVPVGGSERARLPSMVVVEALVAAHCASPPKFRGRSRMKSLSKSNSHRVTERQDLLFMRMAATDITVFTPAVGTCGSVVLMVLTFTRGRF